VAAQPDKDVHTKLLHFVLEQHKTKRGKVYVGRTTPTRYSSIERELQK